MPYVMSREEDPSFVINARCNETKGRTIIRYQCEMQCHERKNHHSLSMLDVMSREEKNHQLSMPAVMPREEEPLFVSMRDVMSREEEPSFVINA